MSFLVSYDSIIVLVQIAFTLQDSHCHIYIDYIHCLYVCISFQFDISIFLEIMIRFMSFLVSYDSIIVLVQIAFTLQDSHCHIYIDYIHCLYVCISFQFDISIFLGIIMKFMHFLVSHDPVIVVNQ